MKKKAWDTYTADIWPRHMPNQYSHNLDRNVMDCLRMSTEKRYTSLQLIHNIRDENPNDK